ncbi:MAG: protein phosphatase [Lachnospiraceae bacterium]|nr:protein phosphatase [Lachnospiraceae bacterium]
MDEEMKIGEMLRELAEENQTRKILEIVKGCEDLDEAIKKIEALLEK